MPQTAGGGSSVPIRSPPVSIRHGSGTFRGRNVKLMAVHAAAHELSLDPSQEGRAPCRIHGHVTDPSDFRGGQGAPKLQMAPEETLTSK